MAEEIGEGKSAVVTPGRKGSSRKKKTNDGFQNVSERSSVIALTTVSKIRIISIKMVYSIRCYL